MGCAIVTRWPSCESAGSLEESRDARTQALSALALPPARLFALISDVARYPEFVPGCTHARIESRSEHEIVCQPLGVRRGALAHGIHHSQ